MRGYLFGLTVLLVAALAACGSAAGRDGDDDRDRTLAVIDGTPLKVVDFERSYVAYLMATGRNDTPEERRRHFEDLVDLHLLAAEARRQGLDRDSVFLAFEARVHKEALGGRFFEEAFLETLEPLTEDEVRRAYARSLEQVEVRHLFYRDAGEAEAAYERLREGRAFLDEAQDCYDLAAFDSSAGYLGPIRYFMVDDAFAEAAFALPVDSFSAPVRSRFGWHIIRVEDRIRPALLAEDAFLAKQEGIASQMRLRKRRLEGDRFVRGFMEGLGVQVDAAGVAALAEAVEALENSAVAEPVAVAPDVEALAVDPRALRAVLTPETLLATYVFEGERRTFTAGDYYRWLEAVPFSEARHRTAASVGRALRNEAMAVAGEARGLGDDPLVGEAVARESRRFLAGALRQYLRAGSTAPPDSTLLEEAYERLGRPGHRRVHADFWVVPFASREEAEAALEVLARDPARASEYAGYALHEEADVAGVAPWGRFAAQAPPGEPALVQASAEPEAWGVIYVSERTSEVVSDDEQRDAVERFLTPLAAEITLLKQLRAEAEVELDTLLFEEIARLR